MCTTCMPFDPGSQKKAEEPQEPQLKMVVSHYGGAGN